jgi:hypothetical protein
LTLPSPWRGWAVARNLYTCKLAFLVLCGVAFTTFYGCVGSRSIKVRGVVRVRGQPVQGVEVVLVSAKEAAARYEGRIVPAISNLAMISRQKFELQARREAVEKERTLKVFKRMFPEVGPAEKEQLGLEIADLNTALTNVAAEEVGLAKQEATWMRARRVFEPPWTNILGFTRSGENGEFIVRASSVCDCWLAATAGGKPSTNLTLSWLIPVQRNSPDTALGETNAIPGNK